MRGEQRLDGVWREVAGFRGPGLSEPSRLFDTFAEKIKMEAGREEGKEVGEKQGVENERMASGENVLTKVKGSHAELTTH